MKRIKWIFIFLVTWETSFWVPKPCPDEGKMNEYGLPVYEGCLVNHGHYEYKNHNKEFTTKEEADKFIKNAPSGTQDFKVEEIGEKKDFGFEVIIPSEIYQQPTNIADE